MVGLGCYSQSVKGNLIYKPTEDSVTSVHRVWYQKPGFIKIWRQGIYYYVDRPNLPNYGVICKMKNKNKCYFAESLAWINFEGSNFSIGSLYQKGWFYKPNRIKGNFAKPKDLDKVKKIEGKKHSLLIIKIFKKEIAI